MNTPFSQPLFTDLYEITMAYGYWKKGMAEREACFQLFFRRSPFQGGYALTAGLESVIGFLQGFRFHPSDLAFLDSLHMYEKEFLDYLSNLTLTCDIDAICEGEIVFPYEPLIRVQGGILQCQLLESALLNLTNFASLIATKASRICYAAHGDRVMEFGLRRAQGIDGAMTASRSSYIGGCDATSNVLAGKVFGIPVMGTQAHSWIMAFDNELSSFQAFAEAISDQALFLVDTYDSLEGVKNAIEVGKWLQKQGKKLLGIRLDSGDLAYLSIEARSLLDKAGFLDAKIVASNELNEFLIADLKNQGAQIAVWGVGTKLVTGENHSALDGVYKLSAIKNTQGEWDYKLKLSEQMTKVSNPGILQVRRYSDQNQKYIADCIYDIHTNLSTGCTIVDPFDKTRKRNLSSSLVSKDLLIPIFRKGKLVYKLPSLKEIRDHATEELKCLDKSIKRFYNPHAYPVGLEQSLYDLKLRLIERVRKR